MDIHQAATAGYVSLVQRLLDQGEPVDKLNNDSHTPLIVAAAAGKDDVVRLLLEAGADPQRFNSLSLDFAVRFGSTECVRLLLNAGADPNRSNLANDIHYDDTGEEFGDEEFEGEECNDDLNEFEDDETDDHFQEDFDAVEITNSTDPPPIMEAMQLGNREIVSLLLAAGAKIDVEHGGYGLVAAALLGNDEAWAFELLESGAGSQGALRVALEQKNIALAEKFLDAGFDVHDAGTDGMTPLLIAAYYGCDAVIPRLVAAGANLEHRDQWNKTALGYAAQERKTEAFHALLQAGASITDAVGGELLLNYTCAQANDEAVRALLEAGVDPNERDSDGKTALLTAIETNEPRIVKILLERGADGNACFPADKKRAKRARVVEKTSPLIEAVKQESSEMVAMLLEAGAEVNHVDGKGQSVADWATKMGDSKILAQIKEAGGIVHGDAKTVANYQLLRALQDKLAEAALQALDAGADANACDADAKSALIFACQHRLIEVVKRLLSAGAQANVVSKWQETPLRHACLRDNAEIVRMLLRAGASANSRYPAASIPEDKPNYAFPSLETPLHDAATYGTPEVLRLLIEAGADLNFIGASGQSPVMAAVNMRRMDSAKILLEAGAIVRPEDECRFVVYRFAERAKSSAFCGLVESMWETLGEPFDAPILPGAKAFKIQLSDEANNSAFPLNDPKAEREWGQRFADDYAKLSARTDQAQQTFLQRVRENGFLLVATGRSSFCEPMSNSIYLLPTADKFEAMFAFGVHGNDQELRVEEVVDWFRKLDAEEPFELRGLCFDSVDIEFAKPVADPQRWAKEMAQFCHDLVGTEEKEIRKLAESLRSECRVLFWWD